MPLKIARPDLQVTFIDATLKRVRFLKSVIDFMGWRDAEAVHGRAEEVGRRAAWSGAFDVVVARAVAKLATLGNWCLPLVRPGGHFVAMKGPDVERELKEARSSMAAAGGRVLRVDRLALPEGAGTDPSSSCAESNRSGEGRRGRTLLASPRRKRTLVYQEAVKAHCV